LFRDPIVVFHVISTSVLTSPSDATRTRGKRRCSSATTRFRQCCGGAAPSPGAPDEAPTRGAPGAVPSPGAAPSRGTRGATAPSPDAASDAASDAAFDAATSGWHG